MCSIFRAQKEHNRQLFPVTDVHREKIGDSYALKRREAAIRVSRIFRRQKKNNQGSVRVILSPEFERFISKCSTFLQATEQKSQLVSVTRNRQQYLRPGAPRVSHPAKKTSQMFCARNTRFQIKRCFVSSI
jgi:hypothetical protein